MPNHERDPLILDPRLTLETDSVGGLAEGVHDLVDGRVEGQLAAFLDHVEPRFRGKT